MTVLDAGSVILLLVTSMLVLAGLIVVLADSLRWYLANHGRAHYYFPHTKLEITLHPACAPSLSNRVIKYRVNEDGERGGRVPRSGSIYRVLVLGGSAAECRLLDQEQTWPAQLAKLLSRKETLIQLGVDFVHVGTIARSQLDSSGLLIMLKQLVPTFPHVDAIVLMNGLSDPLRWVECGAPSGKAAPDHVAAGEFFAACRETRYTWRRPALIHYLLQRVLALFRIEKFPSVGGLLVREAAARRTAPAFRVDADAKAMYGYFRTNLRSIVDLLQQKTGRLLIVRQPWLDRTEFSDEEERSLWSGRVGKATVKPARFLSHSDLHGYCRGIDRIVSEVAEEKGVECLGLLPMLEPQLEIFYDHFHFTPEGARVVAREVAEAILNPVAKAVSSRSGVR